jgi:hypothetical protein
VPAGKQSWTGRFRQWTGRQIRAATQVDTVVGTRFAAVTHMRAHPASLNTAGTVVRSVLANRRHRT